MEQHARSRSPSGEALAKVCRESGCCSLQLGAVIDTLGLGLNRIWVDIGPHTFWQWFGAIGSEVVWPSLTAEKACYMRRVGDGHRIVCQFTLLCVLKGARPSLVGSLRPPSARSPTSQLKHGKLSFEAGTGN